MGQASRLKRERKQDTAAARRVWQAVGEMGDQAEALSGSAELGITIATDVCAIARVLARQLLF